MNAAEENALNSQIAIIDEKSIRSKIYNIRNYQVMLDSDLAEIYGYTTKALNQQVKIILKDLMKNT